MKGRYYHLCPYCGAALDPCEPCDCRESKQDERQRSASPFLYPRPPERRASFERRQRL